MYICWRKILMSSSSSSSFVAIICGYLGILGPLRALAFSTISLFLPIFPATGFNYIVLHTFFPSLPGAFFWSNFLVRAFLGSVRHPFLATCRFGCTESNICAFICTVWSTFWTPISFWTATKLLLCLCGSLLKIISTNANI
jgi:hypothetical protein